MKTAILKIEVSDDFEKGMCQKGCPIYEKENPYFFESMCQKLTDDYCPLEIEYDTNEFTEREIAQMKAGHVISHRPKEIDQ